MNEIPNNKFETSSETKPTIEDSIEASAKDAIEEVCPKASEEQKSEILKVIKEKLPKIIDVIKTIKPPFEPRDKSIKEHLKHEVKCVLYIIGITSVLSAGAFGIGPGPEKTAGMERIKKIIEGFKDW